MTTVQNVQQNKGTNYTVPAAVGGAVAGGLAGAYIPKMPFVPAKYKSAQELVDAMTAKDKFEINLPDKASEEVKNAKTEFTNIADAIKENKKDIDELFKDKTVLTLAEADKGIDAGGEFIKGYDGYKIYKKATEAKVGDEINLRELKGTIEKLGMGEEYKQMFDGLPAKFVLTEKNIGNFKQGFKSLCDGPDFERSMRLYEIIEKNDGKLPRAEFESFTKKEMMPENIDKSFKKLTDYLPKSKVKGAAIWAGIGAAVLGVAGYLLSSKKDAA